MNTGYLSLLVTALVLGSNIIWAVDQTPGNTYSARIREAAAMMATVPLFVGALSGHWFGPEQQPVAGGLWIIIAIGAAVTTVEALTGGWIARHVHPSLLCGLGFFCGSVLWTMHHTTPR